MNPEEDATRPAGPAPAPLLLSVVRPERLRRPTVAVRAVLVIPAAAAAAVLAVGAYLAVFVGWFAALALGHLPDPVARYLGGFVRYTARVHAYASLLTDTYPPLRPAGGRGHPVRVDIPSGPLNRLAVLFRVVLALPAVVVAGLAGAGWAALSVVAWLIALVGGRLPVPLFDAGVAVVRYQTRSAAYLLLLTAAYPWGLFGDAPAGPPEPVPPEPAQLERGPAEPGRRPVVGAALGDPGAGRGPVLSATATRLVALCLALGILGYVAAGVVFATVRGQPSPGVALDEVGLAHDGLLSQVQRFQQDATNCQSAADQLGCLQGADRRLADAFAAFVAQLRTVDLPAGARAPAGRLADAGTAMAAALRRLSGAGSVADYERRSAAGGVSTLGARFDRAFQALVGALGGS